jgi:hypothetical protein
MKKRSDTKIMIDVLEEAASRSGAAVPPNQLKEYGAEEMPIIIDLIQSKMVRGGVYRKGSQQMVGLQGITLEGRQFRDELIAKRDAKRLPARSKRAGLLIGGWIIGLITSNAKELFHLFFK